MATPGVRGGDNATLRLPLNNRPQPDACLIVEPTHGGQVRIVDGYIVGGPELVAEVAATSANYDLTEKLPLYLQNHVGEYVVGASSTGRSTGSCCGTASTSALVLSPEGCFKSESLPGLWLDPAALIRGDMARVAQIAQHGIASPEHADVQGPVTASCDQRSVFLKDGRVEGSPTKDKPPWRKVRHGSTNHTPHRGENRTCERAGKSGRGINPAENVGNSCRKQLRYLNFNAATVTGCRLVLGGEDVVERG